MLSDGGTPPSLHQAAQQIGTEVPVLEKALKIGIKLGDIILVGKNRYVPSTLVINLKISVEKLASKGLGLYDVREASNALPHQTYASYQLPFEK